ncbi:hypothetical protein BHE74_00026656 [Ensete ventricosum]|nr:hypothetical protein BHE74_00026656 [Ensete ventricosum]RZR95079.1 hypothetical protein BHM03_00023879 [Ensete ventricosum]
MANWKWLRQRKGEEAAGDRKRRSRLSQVTTTTSYVLSRAGRRLMIRKEGRLRVTSSGEERKKGRHEDMEDGDDYDDGDDGVDDEQ